MEWLAALLLIPFAVPTVLGFVNMCCCGAECSVCNPTTVPAQYQLDLSGAIDTSGCSNCSTMDGTYVVDQGALAGQAPCGTVTTGGSACTYGGYFSTPSPLIGACSTACGITVQLTLGSTTTVNFDTCSDGGSCSQCENFDNRCNAQFSKAFGSFPNCAGFSGESGFTLTFLASGCCDSSTTVLVSAL